MTLPTSTTTGLPGVRLSLAEFRRTFNARAGNFGRHDLREYQDLDGNISVGNSEIGGVSVDCRFNFERTRWGVIEDKSGGIFYMDLTINQPLDWRLREATVSVILEDLRTPQTKRADKKTHHDVSVALDTEYYGPKSLVGPELSVEKTKSYSIGPQVEAAGFGGSLGEFGSSVTLPRTSWWNFHGTPQTASNSSKRYTILTWVMSQNALAYSAEHPAKIETAFTFFHKYKPFSLRVEINGKLRHIHHKFKDKSIGLFSKAKKEKPLILVFRFDPGAAFKEQLLHHAKLLESDMAKLACQRKHVEVSQRTSTARLSNEETPQEGQSIPITRSTSPAGPAVSNNINITLQAGQDELITQLLRVHTALLNNDSLKVSPDVPREPLRINNHLDVPPSLAVGDVPREEIVADLQKLPASAQWLLAFLVRFWSAWSILVTTSQDKSAPS
ncbi:uncharacterized protein N0V89_009212 [Didymosphaeria variabile]|uniref:Uncharacterized protein n=1 Tax=Didymosphaeria variabile TaxID=1932322 RepID=A0A9W8XD28_9PLEO|nr:uncharacterized protein N0V89_009212 [Didymosphaeria variabile]KAJ4347842.1 hypothetical protein N0V89_009212 [Didymosphaeria variabile]